MKLRYWGISATLFLVFIVIHLFGPLPWNIIGLIGFYIFTTIYALIFFFGFRDMIVNRAGKNVDGLLAKSILSNGEIFDVTIRALEIVVSIFWVYFIMYQIILVPTDNFAFLAISFALVSGFPIYDEPRGTRMRMRYLLFYWTREDRQRERVWVRIRHEISGITIGTFVGCLILIPIFMEVILFWTITFSIFIASFMVIFRTIGPGFRIIYRRYISRKENRLDDLQNSLSTS